MSFRRLFCTSTIGQKILLALVDVKCLNRIMTKKSLYLWSESFLSKHKFFPFQKYFKVIYSIMKIIWVKTNITLQLYKRFVEKWKASYFNSILHCDISYSDIVTMYSLCLVILIKVDTSQVPQQNVYWMPTVKAHIRITCHSEDPSILPLFIRK